MALSLDAIYHPLNDFFLKTFSTGPQSPVMFRFDKFGSIISDADFLDPVHPEQGYSPFRAIEKLSDMVNHIPSDSGDGMSILFRLNTIDETYYYRLLSPSQPLTADGAGDGQSMIANFSALKANAVKTWENIKLESSGGLMFQYKPALAQPEYWYDKNRQEIWTHQSFEIGSAAPPVVAGGPPKTGLWRLKLGDERLRDLLKNVHVLSDVARPVPMEPPDVIGTIGRPGNERLTLPGRTFNTGALRMQGAVQPAAMMSSAIAAPARSFADVMVARRLIAPDLLTGAATAPPRAMPLRLPAQPMLQDTVRQSFVNIRINDRIVLNEAMGQAAPTAPAAADSIKLSFDYCLVKITRPWYIGAFIDDRSWFVPGMAKGGISAAAAGDSSFNVIPVGFVAIKNLQIEGSWGAADLDAAAQAEDFGPFKVTPGISQNKLNHEGMQVIGWLLERMPELPPNAAPN